MPTARVVCAAGLLAWGLTLSAAAPTRAETPIPPAPDRWLTDNAGLLSAEQRASLDARLAAYQQQTGHQVLVYIDRTTGGVPIEDWAARAFQSWRVGRKGIDDGAVLFLFNDDRRLRIEVGYGLEAQVPDARAARIIREVLVPRMQAGDAPGAIAAGVGTLLNTIGGEAPGQQPADHAFDRKPPPPLPWWAILIGGVVIALVLMGVATHPALAAWLLFSIASGRGSGGRGGGGGGSSGFGGGGGGFSGGGGRSGGGGASGSW